MTKKKNVYTTEFKAEAVKMTEDQGVAKTAVDLGVSPLSLRSWSKRNRFEQTFEIHIAR